MTSILVYHYRLYYKNITNKFKEFSSFKKILLLIVILFAIIAIIIEVLYYLVIKNSYHYVVQTLGIPYLSSITGLSAYTIDWILFSLPFYFIIICLVIFLPIIIIIIIKKRKKTDTHSNIFF